MSEEKDFTSENQQFRDAIERFGWGRVLENFTALSRAITYANQPTVKRFDMCPLKSCSGHTLKSKSQKGNFALLPDFYKSGAGYCYKCGQGEGLGYYSGFDIIMEFNNWTFAETCKEIRQFIDFQPDANYIPLTKREIELKRAESAMPTKADLAKAEKRRAQMGTIWRESFPLNSEWALPAAKYFVKRGITRLDSLMRNQVKMHPALPFYIPLPSSEEGESEEDRKERLELLEYCSTHPSFVEYIYKDGEPVLANMGKHPCILLMVRTNRGEARRLHRIFIDENGDKASFHKAGHEVKKMMPGGYGMEIEGCSCYLDGPAPVRGIGEGLETVLAVKDVTSMPMDCCISAGGLNGYQPPVGTKVIFIWEDLDRSKTGENVAQSAKERLESEGYIVHRMVVPMKLNGAKTVDWLDVRNELGVEGFPEIALNWRSLLV